MRTSASSNSLSIAVLKVNFKHMECTSQDSKTKADASTSVSGADPKRIIQLRLPEAESCPAIWIQIIFMYPSTTIMLWLSTGPGKFGNMSMSMPLNGPPASTRISGFGASDVSDRIALLLCRKHNRQFFVSAHVPRQISLLQSGDDNSEEIVLRRVVQAVNLQIKKEEQEPAANEAVSATDQGQSGA